MVEKDLKVGRIYRHYKGGLYKIVGFAMHTETEEELVIYEPYPNAGALWARPIAIFLGRADIPRFVETEDPLYTN